MLGGHRDGRVIAVVVAEVTARPILRCLHACNTWTRLIVDLILLSSGREACREESWARPSSCGGLVVDVCDDVYEYDYDYDDDDGQANYMVLV